MKEKIIAKRYAEAFLGLTKNRLGFDRSVDELKSLKITLFENPDFRMFLENAEIHMKEKGEVIDAVLKDFSPETRQFLRLLLEKDRIKSLIDICDYVRVTYSHGEAIDALLKTSYPLDLELIHKIKDALENKLKRKVSLHLALDGDLLGGIQVKVGNILIDASVRRRLEELREKLMLVKVG